MASDMEAGDWGNIIAEIFSGFSFGGEKGGEPDWKAIERLMEMDAQNNRTDRQGVFSGWEWDQDEEGRWTQNQTLAPGMEGTLERMIARANGMGFDDPFKSPEQFSSLMDAKLANQMEYHGTLNQWPDLMRDFGESSADRSGLYPEVMPYEGSTGGSNYPSSSEMDEIELGGSTSANAEQGSTFQDQNQQDFQRDENTGNWLDEVQRAIESRNGGGEAGSGFDWQAIKDKIGQGGDWTIIEKILKGIAGMGAGAVAGPAGSLAVKKFGGDFDFFGDGMGGMNDPASSHFVGPRDNTSERNNPNSPNFIGPPDYSGMNDPDASNFIGPPDLGYGQGPVRNPYGNGNMSNGRNNSIGSMGYASRIRRDDPRFVRPPTDNLGG